MILYSGAISPRCRRVLASAYHLGYDLDVKQSKPQSPEVLQLNPMGKLPVLQDDDLALYESNAIVTYLADKKGETPLYPSEPKTRALIHQWLSWTIAHFETTAGPVMWENFFKEKLTGQPGDKALAEDATKAFMPVAKVLNDALAGKDYLLGKQITLADYAVAGFFMYVKEANYPLENFSNIRQWIQRIEQQPSWKKAAEKTPGF